MNSLGTFFDDFCNRPNVYLRDLHHATGRMALFLDSGAEAANRLTALLGNSANSPRRFSNGNPCRTLQY